MNQLLDDSVFLLPIDTLYNIKTIGRIVNIYDGDTLDIVILLNDIPQRFKVRLYGIDTPELHPLKSIFNKNEIISNALNSRNYLLHMITDIDYSENLEYTKDYIISTLKDCKNLINIEFMGKEKYGRILAKLYKGDICINDELIRCKLAKPYFGGNKNTS